MSQINQRENVLNFEKQAFLRYFFLLLLSFTNVSVTVSKHFTIYSNSCNSRSFYRNFYFNLLINSHQFGSLVSHFLCLTAKHEWIVRRDSAVVSIALPCLSKQTVD